MKFCTYLITYSGKDLPPYYLGSTSVARLNSGYLGSVSSKKFKDRWKTATTCTPELFSAKILSLHQTRDDALYHEAEMQDALDVVRDERFINLALAKPNGFFGMDVSGEKHPMFGKKHSEPSKQKMRDAALLFGDAERSRRVAHGRKVGKDNGKINGLLPCPEHVKIRLRDLKTGVPLNDAHRAAISTGVTAALASPSVRAKLSAKAKGRKRSAESIAASAAAHTGMKRSEEAKAKMRASWHRRKQNQEIPIG